VQPKPLTIEEIEQLKGLPVLNVEQIARVLQKDVPTIYEMSRKRARRPLPVFRNGRELGSTWARLQRWIEEGFNH
jgi:hypothetical protein